MCKDYAALCSADARQWRQWTGCAAHAFVRPFMLIHTMIEATCKAAHEYFQWSEAGGLSPATWEAQSGRARRELIRLGQELLPVLPDPSTLIRLLTAMNDDCEPGVEEVLWSAAHVELQRVHEQPHLARQPKIPIVSWSRKWGWQKDWNSQRT